MRSNDGRGKLTSVSMGPAGLETKAPPAQSEVRVYSPNALQLVNLRQLNSQASLKVASEYNAYFDELGLSPDSASRLKSRITEVLQAKNEIFLDFEMLSVANLDFKEDIRRELGEEAFANYMKWENGSRARREINSLELFAQSTGIALSQGDLALIAGFVESEEAYSTTTLRPSFVSPHPFEPLAIPFRDRPNEIAEKYLKEADTLRYQTASVIKLLQEAGSSNELISVVSSYYNEKLVAQDKRANVLQARGAVPTVPREGPIRSLPSSKMMEALNAIAAQREKQLSTEGRSDGGMAP
jgi:hypothetical protein